MKTDHNSKAHKFKHTYYNNELTISKFIKILHLHFQILKINLARQRKISENKELYAKYIQIVDFKTFKKHILQLHG